MSRGRFLNRLLRSLKALIDVLVLLLVRFVVLVANGRLQLEQYKVLDVVVQALLLRLELADAALDAANPLLDGFDLLQDGHFVEGLVILDLLQAEAA